MLLAAPGSDLEQSLSSDAVVVAVVVLVEEEQRLGA